MVTLQDIVTADSFKKCADNLRGDLIEELQQVDPGDTVALSAVAYKLWALRNLLAELEMQVLAETRKKG
jgi:hypothetical protein